MQYLPSWLSCWSLADCDCCDFTGILEVFPQLLLSRTVLDILDKHAALVPVVFSWLWLGVLARALVLLLLLPVSYTTDSVISRPP